MQQLALCGRSSILCGYPEANYSSSSAAIQGSGLSRIALFLKIILSRERPSAKKHGEAAPGAEPAARDVLLKLKKCARLLTWTNAALRRETDWEPPSHRSFPHMASRRLRQ